MDDEELTEEEKLNLGIIAQNVCDLIFKEMREAGYLGERTNQRVIRILEIVTGGVISEMSRSMKDYTYLCGFLHNSLFNKGLEIMEIALNLRNKPE